MSKLDLSAYNLTEMEPSEMEKVEGGFLLSFLIGALVGAVAFVVMNLIDDSD